MENLRSSIKVTATVWPDSKRLSNLSAKKTSTRGKNTKTRKNSDNSKSVAASPIEADENTIVAAEQSIVDDIPAEEDHLPSGGNPDNGEAGPVSETLSEPDTNFELIDEKSQEPVTLDPPEEAIPKQDESSEIQKVVAPTPETTPEQAVNGGFLPMFLGGVAAAAIGFGACAYLFPEGVFTDKDAQATLDAGMQQELNAQSEKIAALSDQINTQPQGPDLATLNNIQADLSASADSLSNRMADLEDQARNILQQLTDTEARINQGDVAADYEQDLQALKATVEAMTADRRNLEDAAHKSANEVMKRAAITRLLTALENGSGYRATLTDLQGTGVNVPDALSAYADDGVTSLPELHDSYPDAARAALSASRKAASDNGESAGGFAAFLRTQLGARSLEPREGDGPDAILSRIEAALREARLTDVLAEIETLPEAGRAELSDWAGQVARRQDALRAAERLNQELN